MDCFSRVLSACPEFDSLLSSINNNTYPACVVGLSHIHKAHWVASLCLKTGKKVLLITPDDASAVRLVGDINEFFGGEEKALAFTQKDFCFRTEQVSSREYEHKRLSVLGRILSGECEIVVSSIAAAVQFTIPPEVFIEKTLVLESGKEYDLKSLAKSFVSAGYVRREQVDGTCQFAVRGGIVDIFPPDSKSPMRIEFWGDEIDSIAYFDLDTQRRGDPVDSIKITPAQEVVFGSAEEFSKALTEFAGKLKAKSEKAKEFILNDAEKLLNHAELNSYDKYLPLVYDKPATLFDYLPDSLLVLSEFAAIKEACRDADKIINEDIRLLFEEGVLCSGLEKFSLDFTDFIDLCCDANTIIFDTFARSVSDLPLKNLLSVDAMQLSAWGGELKLLLEDLQDLLARRFCVAVTAGTQKSAFTLLEDLRSAGIPCEFAKEIRSLTIGRVFVMEGSFSGGFEYPSANFALITHSMNNVKLGSVKRKKIKDAKSITSLADLVIGDYVVHTTHGIGVFEGIHQLDLHGIVKDYIKIRYAGTDVLYVAVTQLDMVSKYIGPGSDKTLKLNSLTSSAWQQTKARVRHAVRDMAKELIALYAKRMNSTGYAFSEDNDWQGDFEARFPYTETDDQLTCVREIKADMMRPVPMDRLLCGDVGFGKTEVALRAAFKCVLDSKQCAILVPTTILAWQHYQTIIKRMEGFPVNIELLSRFRTAKQQKEIIKKLQTGEVDVVVGTHRLVQNDIKFKDLGLVIIDEEQRFGVAHKEKLKELRNNVDVLTLSATPIPRTLNMAMSGIRDMSTIEQAPNDRYPVQTYVMEHDRGIIADAIRRELRRGGQVFYLHNHVESIDRCAAALHREIPDARISFAHGKMGEEELSEIWRKLIDHEIDILVCTTIIETGVDVPNCNTLIIEDADRMGLSQLYQLRGRVGRSNRRAFAYLTFNRNKILNEVATKRLSAIKEFTQFGSGFNIALRDLEIRGAGSILGGQQHGHMESVGYDMYVKLLNEAIALEKGEPILQKSEDCFINLPISAHIPESYISNLNRRIEMYRRIAAIQNKDDAMDVTDEFIDRFGEPPQAVHGLITIALLRNMAMNQGIYEISQKDNMIVFYSHNLDMRRAARLVQEIKGRAVVNAGEKPYIAVKLIKNDDPLFIMQESLAVMNDIPKEEDENA